MQLTPLQLRFVDEYLIDLNAKQAAIRAGYASKGAAVQGFRLLTNANVAVAIQARQVDRSKRTDITQDRVLQEFAKIAFGDVRGLFDAAGNLRQPHELSDDDAARVASIEVVTKSIGDGAVEYVHKIRAWDKIAALTQLGRHLGMFKDGLDLCGGLTINIKGDDAAL
jgi:phage terminase small subunit